MSFDIGINFRGSSAYVTDGANETYCNSGILENYPVTRGGATFGWEDPASDGPRDRNSALDRRLAGINFVTATGARFRLDLPAAGSYTVHCALGDAASSHSPGHFDFKDGTTLLFGLTGTGANFMDAAGVEYSAAAWPGGEAGRAVTTGTTIFRVVSQDTSVNCIAHLRVVQATSPPASVFARRTLTPRIGSRSAL